MDLSAAIAVRVLLEGSEVGFLCVRGVVRDCDFDDDSFMESWYLPYLLQLFFGRIFGTFFFSPCGCMSVMSCGCSGRCGCLWLCMERSFVDIP